MAVGAHGPAVTACLDTFGVPFPAWNSPNWLRTKLWEAWRTRPTEYAKTVERTTPYPTLEDFEAQMEAAGLEYVDLVLELITVNPIHAEAGQFFDLHQSAAMQQA